MQHYNDLGEGLKKTTTIDNIRKNIDEKGGIYTGYVESVDFPNKGNVVVRTEEDGQVIEERLL